MSDQRLRKLHDIKARLEKLVAELDDLLNEMRDSGSDGSIGSSDDLHWLLQMAQQREVLATVATLIADPTFDSARVDGEARDGRVL